MKKLLCVAVVAVAVLMADRGAARNAAPKDIVDVMEEAHGGEAKSLRNKVVSGKASTEEAKKLLALYEDLAKNKPPKGEAAAWKTKTEKIVAAAKKVAVKPDDTDSTKALGVATNCMACHKDHRP